MKAVSFRPATPEDVTPLRELVNSAYRGDSSRAGWTTEADLLDGQRTDAESLREMLAKPDQAILMMTDGTRLLGCVYLRHRGDHAYLGMLTILPRAQGGGLGRTLLKHAEEFVAREWGARRLEMTVIRQRAELIAWYERRGYRVTGRTEPFPYGDARFGLPRVADLEFVVLAKPLGPG